MWLAKELGGISSIDDVGDSEDLAGQCEDFGIWLDYDRKQLEPDVVAHAFNSRSL